VPRKMSRTRHFTGKENTHLQLAARCTLTAWQVENPLQTTITTWKLKGVENWIWELFSYPLCGGRKSILHVSAGCNSDVMNKRCFFILVLTALSNLPTQAAETGPLLTRWLNSQTNIHTWSADFVQTRTLKSLVQ